MPNVTAFQKADRLALLIAIDSFFALLENREMSEDASRVAFKIRRCEYEGKPADVKTLMSFLGWSKGKVLHQLKELEEHGFEFKTVKDELDNRRSVQRLYGTETAATTEFFDKCLKVADDLLEAREKAKALNPSPLAEVVSKAMRATRLLPLAAAGWMAAWLVLDTDKVEDINRWSTAPFDYSLQEWIESPAEHLWDHFDDDHDHHHGHDPHDDHRYDHDPDLRARDTTVKFALAGEKM